MKGNGDLYILHIRREISLRDILPPQYYYC